MKLLLVLPPLCQLNTPYPSTAYLTGFLRTRGVEAEQGDMGIELVHRLFSSSGLERVRCAASDNLAAGRVPSTPFVDFFLKEFARYQDAVDPVMRFLEHKDPVVALKLSAGLVAPRGPLLHLLEMRNRAMQRNALEDAFGHLALQDRAQWIAQIFLQELFHVVQAGVDPDFFLSQYAERLASSARSFDPIEEKLGGSTLVDEMLAEIVRERLAVSRPGLVGLSVPFPGNVYGALRIGKTIKEEFPGIPVVMGGGFCNTDLRSLSDPRVFRYVDYITLDDGERPLECLIEHLGGKREESRLFRTYFRKAGKVCYVPGAGEHDIPHRETGVPSYRGLPLDSYLSFGDGNFTWFSRLNSIGRWNKLTMAHGCYWKKCAFCDVTLDYIGRYDPVSADLLVDRIEKVIAETGRSAFHFVDEAIPPSLLRALSTRLLARKVGIVWYGNLRFDVAFTPELAKLMAEAGCVCVTGGLEVASDRLLELMQKGISIQQVCRVTKGFVDAGIRVHAYLMYGFPSQTRQETIDSLEVVRQLFFAGCLHSGFWHRFTCTRHSPVAKDPDKYGVRLLDPGPGSAHGLFADYVIPFHDPTPCDHDRLGLGLEKAVRSYMEGQGLREDVRNWFGDEEVPATTLPPDYISSRLTSVDRRAASG